MSKKSKDVTAVDPNPGPEVRYTSKELEERIKKDFNLLDDPVMNAIVYLAVTDCDLHGYAEADPIYHKYKELFCPWCGKLHRRADHDEESAKFQAEQEREAMNSSV
ncbi:MAG TPA: hypothetical protein VFF14_01455 [Candidatus Deferrimicrobium sp.]|nr:hypothetical protein [Candidatus Deferrimicrobium sp.]